MDVYIFYYLAPKFCRERIYSFLYIMCLHIFYVERINAFPTEFGCKKIKLQTKNNILSSLLNINEEGENNTEETLPIIEKLETINYPNPFNPETIIRFSLPVNTNVKIDVYNIRGQRVVTLLDETFNQGHHTAIWKGIDANGRSVGSGVYFYRIQTETETIINRMMLMK